MSYVRITSCDAPGCGASVRDELPATWWEAVAQIAHGPFPTIRDPRTEVLGSRCLHACSMEHVIPAITAAFEAALTVHQQRYHGQSLNK